MHGPRKENGNNYLLYENGDDCGGGKNYSSRIQMECGETEVRRGSNFDFFVFVSSFWFVQNDKSTCKEAFRKNRLWSRNYRCHHLTYLFFYL